MKQRDILVRVCLAAYLYLLVKIILFKGGSIDNHSYMMWQLQESLNHPAEILMKMKRGNLIPLHEIRRTLHDMTSHGLVNLIGNIAIFMPFGLLVGMLGSQRRLTVFAAAAISCALSLLLELSEAVLSIGSFDVDDIILNTIGGLAGFTLYWMYTIVLGHGERPVRRNAEQVTPPGQIC
ncbi:VanZ like protein [Paenibacillus taihuensis]|uniref:VanZ like protein n=1 Tax=Paenibacillus taihuensis TaxID=1156355 RepID=A0A3D9RKV7_9BACL|nr:VanZ family protein [Paenibacillus taihuensis]REE80178.1 VanZ like protein [Paenibacillus taihuensis]